MTNEELELLKGRIKALSDEQLSLYIQLTRVSLTWQREGSDGRPEGVLAELLREARERGMQE